MDDKQNINVHTAQHPFVSMSEVTTHMINTIHSSNFSFKSTPLDIPMLHMSYSYRY